MKVRNNVRVDFFHGREMHTEYKNQEENIWEYQNGISEKEIKNNVLYTVGYLYDSWDYSGGLMGDSCGERHTVVFLSETPLDVKAAISTKKHVQKYIDKYRVGVLKNLKNGNS